VSAEAAGRGLGTARVQAFSDGVFAVAITLLVLSLQPPQLSGEAAHHLARALLDLWPRYLSYILSFVIVGIFWVSHHNTFALYRRVDRTLLWINLLFLMCVAFVPFPTALLGVYWQERFAVAFYGGTLIVIGLVNQLMWWYASHDGRLVGPDLHPGVRRLAVQRNLTGPVLYALAIAASLIDTRISLAVFVAVPVYYIIPSGRDQHLTATHAQRPHDGPLDSS